MISLYKVGWITLSILAAKLDSCRPKEIAQQTTNQAIPYDLSKPQRYKMHENLAEISGIALQNFDSNLFYAQQDEDGQVFTFKLDDLKTQAYTFGKPGDYEDIAINDRYIFVLRSDGQLFSFPIAELEAGKIQSTHQQKNLVPKGEYEGLAFNSDRSELIILCKECKVDRGTKAISAYKFSVDERGHLSPLSTISIDSKLVLERSNVKKSKFKPSALAQHPKTQEWYILSSINNCLAIADENFQIKEIISLSKADHPQPEGITFDQAYTLYISNEAASKIDLGTILSYPYKPIKND